MSHINPFSDDPFNEIDWFNQEKNIEENYQQPFSFTLDYKSLFPPIISIFHSDIHIADKECFIIYHESGTVYFHDKTI